MMRVLVACEYSGRVRDAFIKKGHDAMSCDLLPSESDLGEHYQGDVFDLDFREFDLLIAHPPCTYLTCSAEWAYKDGPYHQKVKPGTLTGVDRQVARLEALAFVRGLWNSGIPKICIENPVGVIPKLIPQMGKPQYVQQYWFGEDASKKTGLWLNGLPPLKPTDMVDPRIVNGKKRWGNQTDSGQNKLPPTDDRWKIRSYTPIGLANAMAEQWG